MRPRKWIAAAAVLAALCGSGGPAHAAAKQHAPADFDGDGRSDFAVWHPATGFWRFATLCDLHPDTGCGFSHGHLTGTASQAIAVPADYDADGRSDPAVFDPDGGLWTVVPLRGSAPRQIALGAAGDIPVPGNYDSDRGAEPAVYRPSDGTWRWEGGTDPAQFGAPGDRPVPGDYDGDGITDLAVYRPAEGLWIVRSSRDGVVAFQPWGIATDVPVPADYDGDARTDVAIWRPDDGQWWILRSSDGTHYVVTLGEPGDDLVPADYDGDGAAEAAVYRRPALDYSELNGLWLIAGRPGPVRFGEPGEVPASTTYQ